MFYQNLINIYTNLVSTPLIKVEKTRHLPSVDVVARNIYILNK